MANRSQPTIIQGGMGVGVSDWRLAKAVSLANQLGVVSGTALDTVLVRRLQLGDPGGHMLRALAQFPLQDMAERIVDRYFIPGGKSADEPFKLIALQSASSPQARIELLIVSNFVEVYLAKEDHEGLVGINYLEKIQLPTIPSLFGAMIAGVDYVLMGAGIPTNIPGIIDQLCEGNAVELPLRITGSEPDDNFTSHFDPAAVTNQRVPWLERPKFLPIVASATLATRLAKKSTGKVDGFVVEGPTAGGHNAPPRGKPSFNLRGEPIYGDRDQVDYEAFKKLELPFWLAGSYGSPEQVEHALSVGAAGVQVGTAFAFCDESGLLSSIKADVIRRSREGTLDVLTDPIASPAGFPFKVLDLENSLSNTEVYECRERICDLGLLRQGYRKPNGTIGWRCPAEPVESFTSKGGCEEEAVGRKCICNGLFSNIGLAQVRSDGQTEMPIVTCGNDVNRIREFLPYDQATSYTARDVINRLLSSVNSEVANCT